MGAPSAHPQAASEGSEGSDDENDDVDNSAPQFNEKHIFVAMLDESTIAGLEIGLLQRCCIVLQSSASRPRRERAVQTAQQAGRGEDEDEGAP